MTHATQEAPLETGLGPLRGAYVPSGPDEVLWRRLPCAADGPLLTVEPGSEITFDTISHEGILEDQGRDPRAIFEPYDVPVLADAVALARSGITHTFGVDGPHVASRPVAVSGARVGDLLAVTILETLPRVPYGVISDRHGKGPSSGSSSAASSGLAPRPDRDGSRPRRRRAGLRACRDRPARVAGHRQGHRLCGDLGRGSIAEQPLVGPGRCSR